MGELRSEELKGHECERVCQEKENRICQYTFNEQNYFTMGRACFECEVLPEDCLRPECISADGVPRPMLAVNRQLPGPAIQVCKGDRVVVDVVNGFFSDTDTIHWHGQHQRDSPFMDGVPFVTQCPIQGTFRYDFYATTPGTHFWHSHSGTHRYEGIAGGFIVREADDTQLPHYDVDSFDHTIVLTDWVHTDGGVKLYGRMHYKSDDFAETVLINGKGVNTNAKEEGLEKIDTPLEVIQLTPGLRHRLRLIHAGGMNCPLLISFDSHNFTLIATDGQPVEPQTASSITMYSGERFDLVLEANQPVDNYWMRVNGLIDCQQNRCHQGAVIRYDGAAEENPSQLLFYNPNVPEGIHINPLNSEGTDELLTMVDLDGIHPGASEDPSLQQTVDKQFYLGFDFEQVNNTLVFNPEYYPYNAVSEEWQFKSLQINDITLIHPKSPPLSQPDALEQTICRYDEPPKCDGDFCACTYVMEVDLGETVEMVLVDLGTLGDENHPFHLHGYSFNVVAMGKLGSSTTIEEVQALDEAGGIERKLTTPVRKDDVTIPDGGYTIIRFTADNPGWWLLHCHIVFHSETGMAAILHVGNDTDLPPVPEGFPTCGDFVPPI